MTDAAQTRRKIEGFLSAGPYAVVGASTHRAKYGNKVLRCYLQHGREVYPVNPRRAEVEGLECWPDLRHLPVRVRAVSIITPPAVTEQVVLDLPECGASHVWMQPGAESEEAVRRAESLGLTVIAGGPCVLVTLGFRENQEPER